MSPMSDVATIVAGPDHQSDVPVDDVRRSRFAEQFTDPAVGLLVQRHHVDASQRQGEARLTGAVPPHLGHDRTRGPDPAGAGRCSTVGLAITFVERHERARVEHDAISSLSLLSAHVRRPGAAGRAPHR